MEAQLCTVCHAALRSGACPNGHPQRMARRRRRRGRRWGRIVSLFVLALLLAVTAYAAMVWYPARLAGDLLRPSTEEFVGAVSAFRATVEEYPEGTDIEGVAAEAAAQLESVALAREALSEAQVTLEGRRAPAVPLVSSRPAFALALDVHERMGLFYTGGLELVSDLEGVAGYLTEIVPIVPALDDVIQALGRPQTSADVNRAVAAARPISDRLIADLRALTPPAEMGAVHASLLAIGRSIRRDIVQIDRVGGQGRSPVLRALLGDVRRQARAFRQEVVGAAATAREDSLGPRMTALEHQTEAIVRDLVRLQREFGVTGLTLPR